jgi:hypothetical protein
MALFGRAGRVGVAMALAVGTTLQCEGGIAAAEPAAKVVAHDGPFGIAMGEPLNELGPVRATNVPGRYQVLKPSRPNSVFTVVFVNVYSATGVCEIDGNTANITGDIRGDQLREILDSSAETLSSKYGPYKKTNVCHIDAQECIEFWTMKVNEGSQIYSYDWDFSNSPRADKIGLISLQAGADSSIISYPVLGYFNSDKAGCDAASKAAQAASL